MIALEHMQFPSCQGKPVYGMCILVYIQGNICSYTFFSHWFVRLERTCANLMMIEWTLTFYVLICYWSIVSAMLHVHDRWISAMARASLQHYQGFPQRFLDSCSTCCVDCSVTVFVALCCRHFHVCYVEEFVAINGFLFTDHFCFSELSLSLIRTMMVQDRHHQKSFWFESAV